MDAGAIETVAAGTLRTASKNAPRVTSTQRLHDTIAPSNAGNRALPHGGNSWLTPMFIRVAA
jgi:hypothetical protein